MSAWKYSDFYQHAFILVFIALVLMIFNSSRLKKTKVLKIPYSLLIWFLVFFIIGVYMKFNFLIAVSYGVGIHIISSLFVEKDKQKFLFYPVVFYYLAIPIPFLNQLIGLLNFYTTKVCVLILKLCFSELIVDGFSIIIPPNIKFYIGQNCSGLNSILSLITLVILWMLLFKISKRLIVFLFFMTIPVAFIVNVCRIFSIFLVAKFFNMETAEKVWHFGAAYFFYIVSVLVLLIFVKIFKEKEPITLRRIFL